MSTVINVEMTPNPNARKFVLDVPVRTGDKVTFESAQAASPVPLARALFSVAHVATVLFFDNVITVSQDGGVDWDVLEPEILDTLAANLSAHDPAFPAPQKAGETSKELQEIEAVLDRTIRPALRRDGGDVQVVSLKGNELTIHYEGACGCCPGAMFGTLSIIREILREEYRKDLEVSAI